MIDGFQVLSFAITGIITAGEEVSIIFGGIPRAKTILVGLSSMSTESSFGCILICFSDRPRLHAFLRSGRRAAQGVGELHVSGQRTFRHGRERYWIGVEGFRASTKHCYGLIGCEINSQPRVMNSVSVSIQQQQREDML